MNYDFLSVSDGNGDSALMHITADRLTGATTIAVDDITNVPNKFIATYGTLLPSGFIDITTARTFRGHLSGGDLIIDAFAPGSVDAGNTTGQVVVIKPNTWWADKVATYIKNATGNGTPEDGTFSDLEAASLLLSSHATIGGDLKLSGASPVIQATGAGSDIPINIKPKGKSQAKVNGLNIFGGYDYFASGCVWTADAAGSTLLASMTAGVVVINGVPLTVAAINNRAFAASKDVYVDFKDNGDGTAVPVYYDNTINAASPSFATTTGTVRNAIIVTGASSIASAASINQGQPTKTVPTSCNIGSAGIDSLGNKIYNEDPRGWLTFTGNGYLGGTGDIASLTLPILRGGKIELTGYWTGRWTGTPAVEAHARIYVDGVSVQDRRIDAYINHLLPGLGFNYQGVLGTGSKIIKINSYATNGGFDFVSAGWKLLLKPGII